MYVAEGGRARGEGRRERREGEDHHPTWRNKNLAERGGKEG